MDQSPTSKETEPLSQDQSKDVSVSNPVYPPKRKLLWITLGMGFVVLLLCTYLWGVKSGKNISDDKSSIPQTTPGTNPIQIQKPKYLWKGELIVCKNCPQEYVDFTDQEIEQVITEFKKNFAEGEVLVTSVRPGKNGFYYQATDDAYKKIKEGEKDLMLSGAKIEYHYYGPLIVDSEQKTPLRVDDVYMCKKDSDCLAVHADSCGCSAGGKATAINRLYYNHWNKIRPMKGACRMAISNDITCTSEPTCVQGKCQLVK